MSISRRMGVTGASSGTPPRRGEEGGSPAVWPLGAAAGALLAAAALAFAPAGRRVAAARVPAPVVASTAAALTAGFPVPVGVSPGGRYLLLKGFGTDDFELRVVDRASGRTVARHRSADSQVATAWSLDGRYLAFLMDHGGDGRYRAYRLDTRDGRVAAAGGVPTGVAARPAWSADGRLAYVVDGGDGRRRVVSLHPGRREARTLLDDVHPPSGFAWATDGRMAGVPRTRPGSVVVAGGTGGAREVEVAPGGEVRELAWSPRGDTLLATVRASDDEWWTVARVDLATGRVRLAAAQADASSPAFLRGGRIAWSVSVDGEPRLRVCAALDTACADEAGGSAVLSGTSPAGDTLFLIRFSRTRPPVAEAVDRRTGARRVVYAAAGPAGVAGARVDLRAADGAVVPAYLWRAPRRAGVRPAALVRVHGGPALQASPLWDPFIQHLVRCGVDVVVPDYRGSTGHGAAWERGADGDAERALDVRAARDYAVRALRVPPARVVTLGHSYGAVVAARAARDGPGREGSLVLVSIPPGTGAAAGPAPARVAAFHGRNDARQGPRAAGRRAAALLGRRVPVRVLEGEGHSFHRLRSWAEAYAAALAFAAPEGC